MRKDWLRDQWGSGEPGRVGGGGGGGVGGEHFHVDFILR